jgi:hypothetical protein
MNALGWFGGDGEDETWVIWSNIPGEARDRANAIRTWLENHPAAETDESDLC